MLMFYQLSFQFLIALSGAITIGTNLRGCVHLFQRGGGLEGIEGDLILHKLGRDLIPFIPALVWNNRTCPKPVHM
jgi:hypothetical protein